MSKGDHVGTLLPHPRPCARCRYGLGDDPDLSGGGTDAQSSRGGRPDGLFDQDGPLPGRQPGGHDRDAAAGARPARREPDRDGRDDPRALARHAEGRAGSARSRHPRPAPAPIGQYRLFGGDRDLLAAASHRRLLRRARAGAAQHRSQAVRRQDVGGRPLHPVREAGGERQYQGRAALRDPCRAVCVRGVHHATRRAEEPRRSLAPSYARDRSRPDRHRSAGPR